MGKMSGRAVLALEVLKAGGFFREQLETQYRGGEKFAVRLRAAGGQVVKGIGWKARQELEAAGMLKRRECARSTVWPTEHVLKEGV